MALDLAGKLASKPRGALVETKRLTRDLISLDLDAALLEISESLNRCLQSEEHAFRVLEVYSRVKRTNSGT